MISILGILPSNPRTGSARREQFVIKDSIRPWAIILQPQPHIHIPIPVFNYTPNRREVSRALRTQAARKCRFTNSIALTVVYPTIKRPVGVSPPIAPSANCTTYSLSCCSSLLSTKPLKKILLLVLPSQEIRTVSSAINLANCLPFRSQRPRSRLFYNCLDYEVAFSRA